MVTFNAIAGGPTARVDLVYQARAQRQPGFVAASDASGEA